MSRGARRNSMAMSTSLAGRSAPRAGAKQHGIGDVLLLFKGAAHLVEHAAIVVSTRLPAGSVPGLPERGVPSRGNP